jgi:hypothetical protein
MIADAQNNSRQSAGSSTLVVVALLSIVMAVGFLLTNRWMTSVTERKGKTVTDAVPLTALRLRNIPEYAPRGIQSSPFQTERLLKGVARANGFSGAPFHALSQEHLRLGSTWVEVTVPENADLRAGNQIDADALPKAGAQAIAPTLGTTELQLSLVPSAVSLSAGRVSDRALIRSRPAMVAWGKVHQSRLER